MSSVVVHLDTQILVWLYVDPLRSWPAPARQLLEGGVLRYAPMARLELRYLYERPHQGCAERSAGRVVGYAGVDGMRAGFRAGRGCCRAN